MSKKHIEWLHEELPTLVNRGVLSEDGAEQLRQHYSREEQSSGKRVMLILFGILGAILIGGGIILLLAHNWEHWTKLTRAVISILPLMGAQVLAGWVLLKRRESIAWRESSGAFWVLAIGVAIALITQTYHLGGDLGDYLLTWTLLSLPVIYVARSSMVTGLYWVGITGWATYKYGDIELLFWPLLSLGVP